jgi:chaperonin cofactor prefoldin
MLRVEAMERRIKELEKDNELLTAKLQALKNYYGQD